MIISKKVEKINGVNIAYEIFDAVDEMIEYVKKNPFKRGNDTLSEKSFDDADWRGGCQNFKEAEELAINGWEEMLDDADFKSFYSNTCDEENKMTKFKNDVVGYVPIVANVLRGIPNCMINIEKRKVKSKIIHIVYNLSATAGYSSKKLKEAGLKLMSAIVDLEKQGFRIKLTAMQDFTDWDKSVGSDMFFLNLKSEYKKLDLYSTMFSLMHPAMFRVIGFTWYERSPVARQHRAYGTSFGNPEYSNGKMNDCLNEIFKNKNIKYMCSEMIIDKNMDAQKIQENLLK